MKLRTIAFRNMRRNMRRTLLSVTAIMIAAICFVFLFSIITGLKQDMRFNLTTYFNGQVRIRNIEYDKYEQLNPLFLGIEDKDIVVTEIENLLPEALVSPRISFPSAIYMESENLPAMGQGLDFEKEKTFQNIEELIVMGRMPENGKNEVLLSPGLYQDTGVEIGDTLTFFSETRGRGANGFSLEVVGIIKYPVASLNKLTFMAPLDRIQKFLRMGNSVTEVLVRNVDGEGEAAAEAVNGLFEKQGWTDISALAWLNIPGGMFQWISMAEVSYNFMALIFFFLGATVIVNTTMMIIYERTKEIGTIAAMGMTGKQIVNLFFLEALFIAIIGSFLGSILGSLLTLPLSNTGINFTEAFQGIDFEVNPILKPVLTWGTVIKVFVLSTAIAALASMIPSRRAARINPIEALRDQ